MRFRLGLNYPWCDYGMDFGPPATTAATPSPRVPAWRQPVETSLLAPDAAADAPERCRLFHEFARMRSFGVEVCRFFVLADGFCLAAPPGSRPYDIHDGATWEPTLPEGFEDDLRFFARVAAAARMKLVPVLLDYIFARPARVIVNGREHEVPFDPELPTAPHYQQALTHALQNVLPGSAPDAARWVKGGRWPLLLRTTGLRPLLLALIARLVAAVGEADRRWIEAWEIMNEPDFCVDDYGGASCRLRAGRDGEEDGIDELEWFLIDACETINDGGFAATIGFHSAETLLARLSRPRTRKAAARALAFQRLFDRQAQGRHGLIPQFHYYPEGSGWIAERHRQRHLEGLDRVVEALAAVRLDGSPLDRVILGEFATSNDYQDARNRTWPEIEGCQWSGDALEARLDHIRQAAARHSLAVLAMPWSFAGAGERSTWSLAQEQACARATGN